MAQELHLLLILCLAITAAAGSKRKACFGLDYAELRKTNYSHLKIPTTDDGGPLNLKVWFSPMQVQKVKEADMELTVKLTTQITWTDPGTNLIRSVLIPRQ